MEAFNLKDKVDLIFSAKSKYIFEISWSGYLSTIGFPLSPDFQHQDQLVFHQEFFFKFFCSFFNSTFSKNIIFFPSSPLKKTHIIY